ncbi:hypothetical protein Agub_g3851 [Astrephomene gubernaculifera]|uniref:Sulfotransferase domain-containing protein n=1 Tax=Astrephomene gubernaculifera TaxID=47775 RepID=A0AAD3HJQ1_9CHLO|nr:hypothetical protein Agub_g3851 [Astrephomene gubernaculifera]
MTLRAIILLLGISFTITPCLSLSVNFDTPYQELYAPIDYAVVGQQKCGTSSLWNYLREHPDVTWHGGAKESLYFHGDWPGSAFCDNQIEHYLRVGGLMRQLRNRTDLKVGDWSTSHLSCICCPIIFKTINPKIKIIMLLRDPIQRALSRFLEQKELWNGPYHKQAQNHTFASWINQDMSAVRGCIATASIYDTPNVQQQQQQRHHQRLQRRRLQQKQQLKLQTHRRSLHSILDGSSSGSSSSGSTVIKTESGITLTLTPISTTTTSAGPFTHAATATVPTTTDTTTTTTIAAASTTTTTTTGSSYLRGSSSPPTSIPPSQQPSSISSTPAALATSSVNPTAPATASAATPLATSSATIWSAGSAAATSSTDAIAAAAAQSAAADAGASGVFASSSSGSGSVAASSAASASSSAPSASSASFAGWGAGMPLARWMEAQCLSRSNIVGWSAYDIFVENYLAYIPPEQLLVLYTEEFAENPLATVRKVESFLGVQPATYTQKTLSTVFNMRGCYNWNCARHRSALNPNSSSSSSHIQQPHNQAAAAAVEGAAAASLSATSPPPPPDPSIARIDPQLMARLTAFYRPYVQRLFRLADMGAIPPPPSSWRTTYA